MSNRLYDALKFVAQILLPALGTLYFALSKIWGADIFPHPTEIVGTISAIDIFLGTVLRISTNQYNKQQTIQPPDEESGTIETQ